MYELSNNNISIKADMENGTVFELCNNRDEMNWLISKECLLKYGYEDVSNNLLGKSIIGYNSIEIDTSKIKPTLSLIIENGVQFTYKLQDIELKHSFIVEKKRLVWRICLHNMSKNRLEINKLIHWMPVAYVMHKTIEENLNNSCSFSPSLGGSVPFIICKKRNGNGHNMLIINRSGKMKSCGSLCKYKNLFFEKSAPSLSGLILHNAVNAYKNIEVQSNYLVDWQYRDMYDDIIVEAGASFYDDYEFVFYNSENEETELISYGANLLDYPHIMYCNEKASVKSLSNKTILKARLTAANEQGIHDESTLCALNNNAFVEVGPFCSPGERKIELFFEDGTSACAVFAVYESAKDIVEAFCHSILTEKFISDSKSAEYCAYTATSRQGESCAKGSLLLYKNLITVPNKEQIQQVEKNAAYYLRTRWLDENFIAKKQYPGGFARLFDMDYLILEFYLLSLVDDRYLAINSSDTYLMWAYRTSVYRLEETPDKLPRELEEIKMPSIISWFQIEMLNKLKSKGMLKEYEHLTKLLDKQVDYQCENVPLHKFIETEHYFDNAGISTVAELLLNTGNTEGGLRAVNLLLPNISLNNDYRNVAPDRWWEALAPMYHNLWCVLSAKALLTAYEKTLDNRYLYTAYNAMIPMFYNYDWNVVSALNRIEKGNGVSSYCITSPNMNLEYCSRNRFGQSVFKDDFFDGIDLCGDDWDMGLDMVVYLMTFGQSTYITADKSHQGLSCVNGRLAINNNSFTAYSYAAYPSRYFFETLNMSIERGATGFVIKSVTIENGECVRVEVELLNGSNCELTILCEKHNIKNRIYPELVIS